MQVPWYRAKGYKGNLTEAEKHQLDIVRARGRHPAAQFGDLPEEVQDYICGLELDLYDIKQGELARQALWTSALGAFILALNWTGRLSEGGSSGELSWYVLGGALLVAPWLFYWYRWNQNAEEFTPSSGDSMTDEAFRREWEIKYIGHLRRQQRG